MYTDFDWAQAPLSSSTVPVVAGLGYLITLALLPRVIPEQGLRLDRTLLFHNTFLSIWSLVMFIGCLVEMVARAQGEGNVEWMFCEVPGQRARGRLYFWSYLFYISKYYEMVDTFLAVAKRSKPPFYGLHVYHHTLVPLVIWNWMEHTCTLQFVGLLCNTFVHVVMYAYYAFKVLRWPTPWKHWVTRLQIVQFLTSLVMLCVTLTYIGSDLFGSRCSGLVTMWVNIAFNVTLLWQFIGVLYTNRRAKRA